MECCICEDSEVYNNKGFIRLHVEDSNSYGSKDLTCYLPICYDCRIAFEQLSAIEIEAHLKNFIRKLIGCE